MRQWSRRMCQSALLVESNRNCLKHKENLVDYWRFSSMGDSLEYPLGKKQTEGSGDRALGTIGRGGHSHLWMSTKFPLPKEMLGCWKAKQTSRQTNKMKRHDERLLQRETCEGIGVAIQRRNVAACVSRIQRRRRTYEVFVGGRRTDRACRLQNKLSSKSHASPL